MNILLSYIGKLKEASFVCIGQMNAWEAVRVCATFYACFVHKLSFVHTKAFSNVSRFPKTENELIDSHPYFDTTVSQRFHPSTQNRSKRYVVIFH